MPEPERDPARQLAIEAAHHTLQKMVRRNIRPDRPVVDVAYSDAAGVKVVVILCEHQRLTLPPESAAELLRAVEALGRPGGAAPGVPSGVPPEAPQCATPRLSRLDEQILQALRRGPLKGLALARRLGRNHSYVRKRLVRLVGLGLVEHAEGQGYRAAPHGRRT